MAFSTNSFSRLLPLPLLLLLLLHQTSANISAFHDARVKEGVDRAVIQPKPPTSKHSGPASRSVSPLSDSFTLPPSLSLLVSYCNATTPASCPLTQITHARVHYRPSNVTAPAVHTTAAGATEEFPFAVHYKAKNSSGKKVRTLVSCRKQGREGEKADPLSLSLTAVDAADSTDGFVNYIWSVPIPCSLLEEGEWVREGHERMERREKREARKVRKAKERKEREDKGECCPCGK